MNFRLLPPKRTLAAISLVLAAAYAGARAEAPRLEVVEQIATDALGSDGRMIANHWGGHQLRIERHADGSVRALYLRRRGETELEWRLLRRSQGRWSEEATGISTDDVNLLRDPGTDRAEVFAWANDRPLVAVAPEYRSQAVPGGWQSLTSAQRHYSAVGQGPDGRTCIKATENRRGTAATDWLFVCGDLGRGGWQWDDQQRLDVGPRLAYDYLFPGPGDDADALLASAQSDVHRDVAGRTRLALPWVFNGVQAVHARTRHGRGARLGEAAAPIQMDEDATQPATLRQTDAFLDSRGRLLSTYYAEDPAKRVARGFYLLVSDASGMVRTRRALDELPPYGHLRLYESGRGTLWLLWLNKGTLASQLRLYPLSIARGGKVEVGQPTDFGDPFKPYAVEGNAYLAVPRGGTPRADVIDGLVAACDTHYDGQPFNSSSCYPRGGNSQRLLYFRIQLPR